MDTYLELFKALAKAIEAAKAEGMDAGEVAEALRKAADLVEADG